MLILILAASLIIACSSKTVDISTIEEAYLSYGQGGGFTGMKSEYFLFDDGRIFMMSEADTLSFLDKCASRKARKKIEEYNAFADAKIYSPGNHYYYITYHNPDSVSTITWSDQSTEIPPELNTYWNSLLNMTKPD